MAFCLRFLSTCGIRSSVFDEGMILSVIAGGAGEGTNVVLAIKELGRKESAENRSTGLTASIEGFVVRLIIGCEAEFFSWSILCISLSKSGYSISSTI